MSSGRNARACNVQWIRSTVEQCQAAGISVFVKQLGERPIVVHHEGLSSEHGMEHPDVEEVKLRYPKGGNPSEWPEDLRVREVPE